MLLCCQVLCFFDARFQQFFLNSSLWVYKKGVLAMKHYACAQAFCFWLCMFYRSDAIEVLLIPIPAISFISRAQRFFAKNKNKNRESEFLFHSLKADNVFFLYEREFLFSKGDRKHTFGSPFYPSPPAGLRCELLHICARFYFISFWKKKTVL